MAQDETLNGDLTQRAVAHAPSMQWTASPSGTVWRKRFHRVGPPEAGQVTSLVRYEPNATFPQHEHPQGEEIFVLSGVFSDQQGDWPAGSYLLNPEGFSHAPFSVEGCEIFVKLRQYPSIKSTERVHIALDTNALAWQPSEYSGQSIKTLYAQQGFLDRTHLLKWQQCAELCLEYPQGAELYVLSGQFSDATANFTAGSWLRLPKGAKLTVSVAQESILYCKVGGFAYMQSTD